MNSSHSNRSVLIFGGAGFIGSNWAHHLLAETDANVHIFDNLSRKRVEHNLRSLQDASEGTGRLRITIADIRDARAVRTVVSTATEIYHFAAQVAVTTSVDDPQSDFEVNAVGTLNILEAARKGGHRPFLLFTSTNKVYGHIDSPIEAVTNGAVAAFQPVSESQPLDFYSPYGCSKGSADQYVHDYARIFGLPTVVFRMSCIAGPRQFGNEDQGWVAHFIYSVLQGKTISIYGNGRQVRDVLAVQDLVGAFEAARMNQAVTAGQVFNIGGGPQNAVSLMDLLGTAEGIVQNRARYQFRPCRPGDQPVYITELSKFRKLSGWMPKRSVLQIVKGIYSWYLSNQSLFVENPIPMPSPKIHEDMLGEMAS